MSIQRTVIVGGTSGIGLATAEKLLGSGHDVTIAGRSAERLEQAANMETHHLAEFLEALQKRHEYFHAYGCRLSDHGLSRCYADFCSPKTAAAIAGFRRTIPPPQPRQLQPHERLAVLDERCDAIVAELRHFSKKERCGENWLQFTQVLSRLSAALHRLELENGLL